MYKKILLMLIVASLFCGVVSADCNKGFTDYGGGVLYFKVDQATAFTSATPDCFATELSKYISDHPHLKINNIFAWAMGNTYNSDDGYFVIVENKTIDKMHCTPDAWDGSHVGTTVIMNYTCMEE
jgi:hypothetical protein